MVLPPTIDISTIRGGCKLFTNLLLTPCVSVFLHPGTHWATREVQILSTFITQNLLWASVSLNVLTFLHKISWPTYQTTLLDSRLVTRPKVIQTIASLTLRDRLPAPSSTSSFLFPTQASSGHHLLHFYYPKPDLGWCKPH